MHKLLRKGFYECHFHIHTLTLSNFISFLPLKHHLQDRKQCRKWLIIDLVIHASLDEKIAVNGQL